MSPNDANLEQLLERLFGEEPSEAAGRTIDARVREIRASQATNATTRTGAIRGRTRLVLGLGVVGALAVVLVGLGAFAPQLLPQIGPPIRIIDRGSTGYDLGDLPLDAAQFVGNRLVIAGTVEEHGQAQWASNEMGYIYTPAVISVENVLRGTYDGATLTVQSPGGRIGGLEMRFSDQTDLRGVPIGTGVLLFLSNALSGSGVPPTPNMAYTVADGVAAGLGPEHHQIPMDEFKDLIAKYDPDS